MKKLGKTLMVLLMLILTGCVLSMTANAAIVSDHYTQENSGYTLDAYCQLHTNDGGFKVGTAFAQSVSDKPGPGIYPITSLTVSAHVDEYILGNFNRQMWNSGTLTTFNQAIAYVSGSWTTAFAPNNYDLYSHHRFVLDNYFDFQHDLHCVTSGF